MAAIEPVRIESVKRYDAAQELSRSAQAQEDESAVAADARTS